MRYYLLGSSRTGMASRTGGGFIHPIHPIHSFSFIHSFTHQQHPLSAFLIPPPTSHTTKSNSYASYLRHACCILSETSKCISPSHHITSTFSCYCRCSSSYSCSPPPFHPLSSSASSTRIPYCSKPPQL